MLCGGPSPGPQHRQARPAPRPARVCWPRPGVGSAIAGLRTPGAAPPGATRTFSAERSPASPDAPAFTVSPPCGARPAVFLPAVAELKPGGEDFSEGDALFPLIPPWDGKELVAGVQKRMEVWDESHPKWDGARPKRYDPVPEWDEPHPRRDGAHPGWDAPHPRWDALLPFWDDLRPAWEGSHPTWEELRPSWDESLPGAQLSFCRRGDRELQSLGCRLPWFRS